VTFPTTTDFACLPECSLFRLRYLRKEKGITRNDSNAHDERDHDVDMDGKPAQQEKDVEAAAMSAGDGHVVASPPINVELEKRVRRKLDRNLVPLLAALYLLAFLDRSNIG
jgi:hypothetical protein